MPRSRWLRDAQLRAGVAVLVLSWLFLVWGVVPAIRDAQAAAMAGSRTPPTAASLPQAPAAAAAAAAILGTILLALWLRSQENRRRLAARAAAGRRRDLVILLASFGALCGAALLAPGDPTLMDSKTHIARIWHWGVSLRHGALPLWTDLWYGGCPVLAAYPPLSHVAGGLLVALDVPAPLAAKLLVWAARILGTIGFGLLAARLHRDRAAGLLAGLLYGSYPPWHAAWIWEGRLPGAVLLGILPFALLLVERLAVPAHTDERPRWTGAIGGGALLLGLACGALAGTHLGQARPALVFVAGFAVLRFAATWRDPGARARGVGIVGGLAFGALLALLVVAPMLHEAPRLSGPFGTSSAADTGGAIPQVFGSGFQPRLPDPTEILGALRWNRFGRHYLGLVGCLLACLGLLRVRRTPAEGRAGWRTLLAFAVAPWFILAPSERGLDLIHIGGLLLASGAIRGWSARGDGARGDGDRGLRAATVLLIAFAVLDQLPFQALSSYTRTRDDRAEAYRLLETGDGGHRLLEFRTWPGSPLRGNIWSYAPTRRVPAAGGPFYQGAPREYWYTAAVVQAIGAKLAAGGKLDADDARLLGFFDIGELLFTKPLSEVIDPSTFAGEGWRVRPGDRTLRVESASPVAVLPDASVPSPAFPTEASLGVDGLATEHADAMAAEIRAWLTSAGPRPVAGTRARVLPDRWELELPADDWGAVRLARNSYPGTVVEVDGAPVGWSPAPLGGILIRLEPGAHELIVRTGTPIAAACWWAGGVLSAIAIAAAAVALRRTRPGGPRSGTTP